MTIAVSTEQLAFIFGVLGNFLSFMVYLSPLPTFKKIYRRRSTEGYQSFPYAVALFSAMLYLYYATLKQENAVILITINGVGFFIEAAYLIIYMTYATPASRFLTKWILVTLNLGFFTFVILFTFFAFKGKTKVKAAGWSCVVFSICMFAAPLCIMDRVIRTRSVRYMPLMLTLALTVSAVVWFFYGFLINDFFIAFPNIVGFAFGIAQIALYACYRNCPAAENTEQELSEVARPAVNEVLPVDGRSANGAGGHIHSVNLEENTGEEIDGNQPIVIKVVDNAVSGAVE